MRLSIGLKAYANDHNVDWTLTEDELEIAAEIEAVLRLIHSATKLVQTEQYMIGAYSEHVR